MTEKHHIVITTKGMPPCINCPNRELGCHSNCEPYQAYANQKIIRDIKVCNNSWVYARRR